MKIEISPVRKLKKSYKNVTGLFFSQKLGRLVQFDSMLERDFILLLDLHPAVTSFSEQPMRIEWIDTSGAWQTYVPDFYVAFSGPKFLGRHAKRPWIVETKYRGELISSCHLIKPKIRAGISEARRQQCIFHVVTERILCSVPVANAKFLRKFVNGATEPSIIAALCESLSGSEVTTVGSFVSKVSSEPAKRNLYMQHVWMSIARGVVRTDIEKPLSVDSCIWIDKS